jgi:ubiquinone/menaquinone biosynthesis C-methylase UbiE
LSFEYHTPIRNHPAEMERSVSLEPVNYDRRQHEIYAEARAMDRDVLAMWMSVFADHLPSTRPLTILDLGSGTGRLTPALAMTFVGPTYGVEPSANMRRISEAASSPPNLTYLRGEASNIPLTEGAADAVLMFLSFHHVQDRLHATAEISRVLRPGARVLLRSNFSDRMPGVWWSEYFPRWNEISAAMFPSSQEVTQLFAKHGRHVLALVEISERYANSPEEAVDRLRLRGISIFEHLTDEEIATGFEALDAALAADRLVVPLTGRSDLLVLG